MTGACSRVDGCSRVAAVPATPLRVYRGVGRRRAAVERADVVPAEQINRARAGRRPARHREVDGVYARDRRNRVAPRHTVRAANCADEHELTNVGRGKPVRGLGNGDTRRAVDGAGQALANSKLQVASLSRIQSA